MGVYKLRKPIEFEGKTYTEINLDLESLNGGDILAVGRQFGLVEANQTVLIKEYNKEYQTYVAARASKLPAELFFELSAIDFSVVTIKVQNFFLEADSEV